MTDAWTVPTTTYAGRRVTTNVFITTITQRFMSTETTSSSASASAAEMEEAKAATMDYEIPEDAVITIKPNAMKRLRELRRQQQLDDDTPLVLRMGVRSGGCSGMSYVMDIAGENDAITEDDTVDEYPGVSCVVDAKSMLYLYGLELDYSDALVGGGFKFINPNAEESCGCGSSFGV